MKKIFRMAMVLPLVCGALAFTGCTDYEDDINSLGDRVTAVENALSELQSKIDGGAVITSVTQSENGVTIKTSDGKTYEITNGKDGATGATGADGKPGSVVEIGSNGNWFIDGVDTGKPSRGETGATGPQGPEGPQGPQGPQGPEGPAGDAGADAPTVFYRPNMETGCWDKVTVDPETGKETVAATTDSWKAAGLTAVWDTENGTLTFTGVTDAEGNPAEDVVISLNSTLKSLAFVPEVLEDGLGVIDFYNVIVKDKSNKDVFVTSNQPEVTYRINPKNADLSNISWSFINRTVETRVAGDNSDLISIIGEPVVADGGITFSLKAGELETVAPDATIVALRAVSDELEDDIVSDYSFVKQQDIKDFSIINKDVYYDDDKVDAYPTPIKAGATVDVTTINGTPDLEFVYDKELNISDYLETYENVVKKALPEINISTVTYEVELPEDKYLEKGQGSNTDQNAYVDLSQNGSGEWILSVDNVFAGEGGRPAIGRTPVLEVTSHIVGDDGKDVVLAECYIVVKITDISTDPIDEKTYITEDVDVKYVDIDPDEGYSATIYWDEVSQDILSDLNMSYPDFVKNFDIDNIEMFYYNKKSSKWLPLADKDAPVGVTGTAEGFNGTSTATAEIALNITNQVDEQSEGRIKIVIPSKDEYAYGNVAIEFNYTVTHPVDFPAFNPAYLKPGTTNTVQVKGKLNETQTAWVMQSSIKEHFEDYLAGWENPGNHTGEYWAVLQPLEKDGTPVPWGETSTTAVDQTGVEITDGTPDWTTAEIALTAPLTKDSFTAVVTIVVRLANGHYCEIPYNVEFVSPFVITLGDIELKTLTAEAYKDDMSKYIEVRERGDNGRLIYGLIDEKKGTYGLTDLAKNTYKLSTIDFAYDLVFGSKDYPAYDSEASFGENLTIEKPNVVWNNDGTILQKRKHAGYKVTMTVKDICEISKVGNIEILTSAESAE